MDKQVVISVKTVLFLVLLLLGGYVVYRLAPILSLALFALLLVLALEPAVKLFSKQKVFGWQVNRTMAVLVAYLLLVLVIAGIVTVGLPPVVNEGSKLITNLPKLADKLPIAENLNLNSFIPQFSTVSNSVLGFVLGIFSNITTIFTILMLSIYLSLDWINLKEKLFSVLKNPLKQTVQDIFEDSETTIGNWVKGQLVLMTVIGFCSYGGLVLLGVEYPLALGLISGVLEAVPVLGPVISGIIAAIIASAESPVKGLAVVVLFVIIQQVENNFLVPRVMQKVTGYSSIVILLVLLVAGHFFGVPGAILGMPTFLIIMILIRRLLQYSARVENKS